MSSVHQMTKVPAFLRITELGTDVVPFLIRTMQSEVGHFYLLIGEILHGGPTIPEWYRGNIAAINEIWLEWYYLSYKQGAV